MEFSSQISQIGNNKVITKLLVIIMLLLHIVPTLSKNNEGKQQQQQQQQQLHQAPQKHHFIQITKITRLKFGQDQFFLKNTNITSNNNNKDGSGSDGGCGLACSTIFNAYSLSDSCKCSCPRGFQTYLTGENRCQSNDKRKT